MNSKTFILASVFVFGLLPILALAQAPLVYKPLVGIPGIGAASSFGEYINALYGLSIAVAALMAVIKIIIAGVKYMLSDVVTSKQEAIGDIKGSLLGLGVVISAVLVLTIINPQLTKTEIFIDTVVSVAPAGGPPAPQAGLAVSGPGYDAVPYVQAEQVAFRSNCRAAGGFYDYIMGSGALMVCYKALPAATLNEITTKYLPRDQARMKDIYQKTIIPRQASPASVNPKINTYASNNDLSVGTIYLTTEHPNPLTWLDKGAQANMTFACQALKSNVADADERGKIQLIADPSFYACVTLTPLN